MAIKSRRILLAIWPILLFALVALWIFPISYRVSRCTMLILMVAVWCGALLLFGKSKWVQVGSIALALLLAAALLLPGRNENAAKLRQEYVAALEKYEGTRYVWGGENWAGIDCSGLVRRGLIDADFKRGWKTANPGLLRASLALWWFDSTAKALGEEYRGQSRHLFDAASISGLDHSKLLPGDFAVTSSGVHTLAYLGNEVWIEADPGVGKVIRLKVSEGHVWFNGPVRLMRWRQLQSEK